MADLYHKHVHALKVALRGQTTYSENAARIRRQKNDNYTLLSQVSNFNSGKAIWDQRQAKAYERSPRGETLFGRIANTAEKVQNWFDQAKHPPSKLEPVLRDPTLDPKVADLFPSKVDRLWQGVPQGKSRQ